MIFVCDEQEMCDIKLDESICDKVSIFHDFMDVGSKSNHIMILHWNQAQI